MKLLRPLAVSLLLAAAAAAGCNLVAGAYLLAHGPEKNPALFTLPRQASAVIAIDDRGSVIPQRSLRDTIGKTAEEEILQQNLVREMVAARLATAVMSRERYGQPMSIADIGKAVNADIVIYVTIDQFSLSKDGSTLSPIANGRVKIIDSHTGQRLGPPEGSGDEFYPLVVDLPAQGEVNSVTSQQQRLQDLARVTGNYLARMFYDGEKLSAPTKLEPATR